MEEAEYSQPVPPVPVPNLLGEVLERDVTFCVDTSGSMYSCLDIIKEQLIETLMNHARRGDTTFNIIEFNSQVTQWADKLVKCTAETVAVAVEWINKLSATTGTNTLDALLTALSDSKCRSVYLITDGLPDQFSEDILDNVANVVEDRPIHCIYLAHQKADAAATEFLEDLAVESYGSFHIVTFTTHGCVEKITPIYRCDHGPGRVIRTVDNILRKPDVKMCSVATTLAVDPEDDIILAPRTTYLSQCLNPYPWWPPYSPYRYYYPSYWSRYRPAKAWLKAQDALQDEIELSPGAGALLLGKKVMARRMEDGYFYLGKVQSQILSDKFLVAFGPNKHGKYKDTSYQDTFVWDIIDFIDAKRHTILTGDRVLAPWEPEGERYGPGIVIDGHEKRQNEGPSDQKITVTFSDGKTEKVPLDAAIWIPEPVYERLTLELKMPREARETLQTQEDYPQENLTGYPTSGAVASPAVYPRPATVVLNSDPIFMNSLYRYPPYPPLYHCPMVFQQHKATKVVKAAVKSEDVNAKIPGTDITQRQLDDKVTSQLMEHKLLLDEKENEKVVLDKKLLKKREKQLENSLKKSVSFNEAELLKQINYDAEHAKDMNFQEFVNQYGNAEMEAEIEKDLQSTGVNTDSSLLFYRSRGLGRRPPWKYWNRDPSPSKVEVKSSHGAFRETALQAPLEARDQRALNGNVEWPSSAFKYVDPYAKHDYSNSVELLMRKPRPPATSGDVTRESGSGVAGSLGYRVETMTPEELHREYRRHKSVERQSEWDNKMDEKERTRQAMQDQHHERVLKQLAMERDRQVSEKNAILQAREAKKDISRELRARIEKNQEREMSIEEQRINAMKERRERREAMEAQREKEIAATIERRQQIKVQKNQARLDARTAELDEEEATNVTLRNQQQNAKAKRFKHFQEIEQGAQKMKDLRIAIKDQQHGMLRSQIFP